MMKLQIVSDVHLEFLTPQSNMPTIEKHGDMLALLGDVGNPFSEMYSRFIQKQSENFERVFVLLGNHEYYRKKHTVQETLEQAQAVCSKFDNVHLLDRSCYNISDNTTIVGCTLWSDIDDYITSRITDFKAIKSTKDATGRRHALRPSQYREWHNRDVLYLQDKLEELKGRDKNVIVLTHHGPAHIMNGKYENGLLTSAFTTDLKRLFECPVIAWCSGHTHSSCDVSINGIRSVSNMLGYPGEKDTGYKPDVCIEFD